MEGVDERNRDQDVCLGNFYVQTGVGKGWLLEDLRGVTETYFRFEKLC